ncbi:hypothetical protein BCEP27_20888 [Burkholderia cepacia]
MKVIGGPPAGRTVPPLDRVSPTDAILLFIVWPSQRTQSYSRGCVIYLNFTEGRYIILFENRLILQRGQGISCNRGWLPDTGS